MPVVKDAVIIGAGPAGIAAAIYLKRAGAEIALFEKAKVGGLLRSANLVENYPGFPEGISGLKLVSLFEEQLEAMNIRPVMERVTDIEHLKNVFRITAGCGKLCARNVLIATGTRPIPLVLEGSDGPAGTRIFYDVNAVPKREGRALVIGGGDAAFDYALNLDGRGMDAIIVSRSKPKCLKLLAQRAREERISVAVGCTPKSVRFNGKRVELKCASSERSRNFEGDFILVATGRTPDTGALDGLAKKVKVKGRGPETNLRGLYMIGDVLGGSYRQTGIAVGSGVLAAMMIEGSMRGRQRDESRF